MSAPASALPKEIIASAKRLARRVEQLGDDLRDHQRGQLLLLAGDLAYRLASLTGNPAHWDRLLGFAHAALHQALLFLPRDPGDVQFARTCEALGLVCREIARRTDDPHTARRAVGLLGCAAEHPSTAGLADAGLSELPDELDEADRLLAELEGWEAEPDRELLASLTPRTLDLTAFYAWLNEQFGVGAAAKDPARLGRLRGLAAAGVKLWRRVGPAPPLAAASASRSRPVRTPGVGRPDPSPPRARVWLPIDEPDEVAPKLRLKLRAERAAGGVQVTLLSEAPDHEYDRFSGWRIAVSTPESPVPREVRTDEYGTARLDDVSINLIADGTALLDVVAPDTWNDPTERVEEITAAPNSVPPVNLRDLRTSLALSRDELARALGASVAAVEDLEERGRVLTGEVARERLALLAEIADLARIIYSPQGVEVLLHEPMPVFDGRTGLELLERGEGRLVFGALASDYEGLGF